MDVKTSSTHIMENAALEYARLGFAVLPLEPRGKKPLGKLVPNGLKNATIDEETIHRWWSEAPDANIGVACGKASNGLVVIDIDNHNGEDGSAALERWQEKTGLFLPDTLTAVSGSGGLHLYYFVSEQIRNRTAVLPGVDVRGHGGYIVAPPSIHESGGQYRWVSENGTVSKIAAANEAVIELVRTRSGIPQNGHGVEEAITEGRRNDALYTHTMKLRKAGASSNYLIEEASRFNQERLRPPLDPDEVNSVVSSVLNNVMPHTATTAFTEQSTAEFDRLCSMHPENASRYKNTELGWGRLFADVFKDVARYCPDFRSWLVFDGKRWVRDKGSLKVSILAKRLADALHLYLLRLPEDKRSVLQQGWGKWQKLAMRETILKDAASEYPVKAADLDADINLINVENGTLDLGTMELRPHDPNDLITKLAPIVYDEHATFERWERFIHEITEGNTELEEFLQRCLGYSLGGSTELEKLFILYGPKSRNGKSTLMEAVLGVLGDYGASADPEMLSLDRKTGGGTRPTEDLARLDGIRFVSISEPSQQMKVDAAKVKQWTGGDIIKARFLNENSFEYKPQFKFYLNTNVLPTVTDSTLFESERVVVIPFNRHFTEEEQDKTLKRQFAQSEARSSIFAWLVRGWASLQDGGLRIPDDASQVVEEYGSESDAFAQFAEACLEPCPGAFVSTANLLPVYNSWAQRNGFEPSNKNAFRGELERSGMTISRKRINAKGNATSAVIGYRLKPELPDA